MRRCGAFLIIFNLLSVPLAATRSESQEQSCQEAIRHVRADIEGRLGGFIERTQQSEIIYEPLSPYQAKQQFSFSLDGSRGPDIMNSEVLLGGYADQIIKACKEIVRVDFWLFRTDWGRGYSWMDNSYTRKDECVEPRRDVERELQWGQQICL